MKRKLLHIVLYLPYGGLEKIVYDFSKELVVRDYEVHVAALEKGGAIGDLLQQNGIPVHILGKRPGKFDFRLLINLIRLINKLKIQAIHSHSSCIMYAALAGRLAGVKVIVHTEHGRYLPDSIGRIWEDRIFSRMLSKYVCVSKELEKYLLTVVKAPSKKLMTIINGVNTSMYRQYSSKERLKLRAENNISHEAIVLGTICRLIPPKNVQFLIDWMKRNSNTYENLVLLIVGDGPLFAKLSESAKGLPKGQVRLLGARGDIPNLLNIFDIFTLPSRTEGTSLTILEAMSTQLPVIASDVGGNIDIIDHGKTGYLFECDNLDAFGACLHKVICDSMAAKKMGICARDSVEQRFSFITMINKYCDLY